MGKDPEKAPVGPLGTISSRLGTEVRITHRADFSSGLLTLFCLALSWHWGCPAASDFGFNFALVGLIRRSPTIVFSRCHLPRTGELLSTSPSVCTMPDDMLWPDRKLCSTPLLDFSCRILTPRILDSYISWTSRRRINTNSLRPSSTLELF